jgi:hypothetical protein
MNAKEVKTTAPKIALQYCQPASQVESSTVYEQEEEKPHPGSKLYKAPSKYTTSSCANWCHGPEKPNGNISHFPRGEVD